MKTLTTLLILLSGLFIMLFTNAFTENDSTDAELSNDAFTFILSGSVTSGHPDLSWNNVTGATIYELHRLPVPYFGNKDDTFVFTSSGSYLDTAVHGAVLGGGIQQVRYVIEAYNDGFDPETGKYYKFLIDSAGPVDYTADSID